MCCVATPNCEERVPPQPACGVAFGVDGTRAPSSGGGSLAKPDSRTLARSETSRGQGFTGPNRYRIVVYRRCGHRWSGSSESDRHRTRRGNTSRKAFRAYRGRQPSPVETAGAVSYTHLRAHETVLDLVCRLLL